jgi:hypothetical protein
MPITVSNHVIYTLINDTKVGTLKWRDVSRTSWWTYEYESFDQNIKYRVFLPHWYDNWHIDIQGISPDWRFVKHYYEIPNDWLGFFVPNSYYWARTNLITTIRRSI